MARQTLLAAAVLIGAATVLTTSAWAGVITITLPSYDSPGGYDFVNTFPPSGATTIGTFAPISIPAGDTITGITISGSFGNNDGSTTALSDYYLGFSGNETAVEVASCDDISDNCYSGQEGPYTWADSLTSSKIAALASAISSGSLDFTYTWDHNTAFVLPGYEQYVYAGPATINIQFTSVPEPGTLLPCFSCLVGVVALRRFRKNSERTSLKGF